MARVNTGLKVTDFQEGKLVRIDADGKSIVVGMTNGKLYAMDSVCSHEGGPLEDGLLEAYNLTCPWHQGIFDIRNAKASPETSWVTDLKSYSVIDYVKASVKKLDFTFDLLTEKILLSNSAILPMRNRDHRNISG